MSSRIELLIQECTNELSKPESCAFLPEIIEYLKEMQVSSALPQEEREKLAAGGMGHLVMQDYDFSESPLGNKLFDLINDFCVENYKEK